MNLKINLPGIKLEQYKLGIDKKRNIVTARKEGRERMDPSHIRRLLLD